MTDAVIEKPGERDQHEGWGTAQSDSDAGEVGKRIDEIDSYWMRYLQPVKSLAAVSSTTDFALMLHGNPSVAECKECSP